MIIEKVLKNIIEEVIKAQNQNFDLAANYEWDSLIHLSILIELENEIPGINELNNLSECLNYNSLSCLLKENGLME